MSKSTAEVKYEECPQDANGLILETPEIRAFGLSEIRKMMAANAGFKYVRTDDKFLLAFLRARKYKVNKSHECLVNFSKFWYNEKYRAIIEGLDAEKMRGFYKHSPAKVLEGTDRMGNALGVIDAGKMDIEGVDFAGQVRLCLYSLADMLDKDDIQLRGATYVESFAGFSLAKAMGMNKAMSSAQQKELMGIMMDSFPIRIRGIYIIHAPFYFNIIWAVAKLFFKKKITERVKMIGSDMAKLHELVDPKFLPPTFGGTLVEAEEAAIDRWVAKEKATGQVGGFAVPFSVDHPCGKPAAAVPTAEVSPAASAGAGAAAGAGAVAVVTSH